MESILLAQHEITTNISQLLSNYKKDGNNRKTKNYLEKKIAYVKAAQREFIANDDKILAISPLIGNSHPYRSTRKTTQEECTWLLADMRQRLNAGPPSTPTGSSVWATDSQPDSNDDFYLESRQASPEPTLHVDNQQSNTSPPCEKFGSTSHYNKHQETTTKPLNTTFKRQDFYMRQLHQEIFAIEGRLDNETCPKEYLQLKVNQLQGQMNDIYQLHPTIMVETDEEDKTTNYFVQDYYGTIKNRAETMIIRLQQCQELAERLTSKPHVEQKVKLPQVELPSFYGDYEKWTSFRDLFIEVIHNNDGLSNTVKMTYLKSKLQKGASQLIAHLATTGENYNMAWASIKARYDNKRLLSNNYFNSLLTMPTAQQVTGTAIRSMHDTLKEVLHNIQQLNLESSFEAFIVFLVTKRLDPESIRLFEANLQQPKEIPTLHVLFDFLERRFQSLDAMGKERHITTPRQAVAQPLKRVNIATASVQCVVPDCHGNHKLETCPWFKKMPTLERAKLVSHLQLCVRCLESHQKSRCSTTEICVVCNGKHNTLLHCNNSVSKTEKASKTFVVQQTSAVLLPTAIVQASTANGQLVILRALIDPGSQATLISSKAVNRFDFKKKKSNIKITGIGGQAAGICKHSVNTTLSPNFPGNFTLAIEALVFDNLDHQLPRDKVDDSKWTHLGRLKLADPRFNHPQPIDLIIGADYYTFIAISNIIKSGPNDPMAQETELGWILMGNLGQSSEEKFTMVTTKSIENQLKLLVENDNIPDERIRTEEEQRAEEHFSSTVQRNRDGRYTVRIPFKEDPPQLGESKKTATARLLQLERKFKKDTPFKHLYQNFMQEYIDLGHMELLPKVEEHLNYNSYYIPHHGIMKRDSTTTKLRVVFDASSKTTNGSSLNEKMMIGPKLQQDLADIILRWRKHQYVLTADIEKMYRQVWVHEQDRNCQLILWRTEPTTPIDTYRLKTVKYGTTAASFLAVRALKQLAEDERRSFPIASEVILSDFYVDDLLTGSDSIDHCSAMMQQLMGLTAKGGLKLRKWSSNSKELLAQIPTELQATGNVLLKLSDCIKTLGIHYNPKKDTFQFYVDNLEMSEGIATKRSLLADSSKLFDPIGWLAPVTIAAKILMQNTWISGIEWDEQLPEEIGKKWLTYKNEMSAVKEIKISRWVNTIRSTKKELHGFADASEHAYAAVVYCKTTNEAGQVTTNLVMAKTRVAPIKTKLSIPRLELNAARLLAKLLRHVQQAMQLNDCETHAWTDSTITLSWIKGEPRRFKTFVANRISSIRQNLPTTTWHHIRSYDNPADLASRGTSPRELVHCNLWWHGPALLQQDSTQWDLPRNIKQNIEMDQQVYPSEDYEEKTTLTATTNLTNVWLELFQRISSYDKLKRVVAHCATFINRVTSKIPAIKAITAETIIFRMSQEKDFHLILQNLEDTQHCLLDIVYSAHREILHPTILTPDQLEDQLSLIRQHVPTVINVPGHQLSDLIYVYQSLTVRSRMTKQNVIIEIIIPLAFATEYTLLSVISVPDILHDNTQSIIVTSTEYLAMDNHREHFAFFSTEQLSRCQIISSSHFLCEASPIFNAFTNNGRCEVAILQRKFALEQFCNFKTSNSRNRWIPLHAPNQWIYAVPNETTVDVLCGSQSSPNTLQGSGIISIDAGCILRDKDLYIVAVGTASNAISKAFHKSNLGITTSKQLKNLGNHIKGKVRDDAVSGLIPVLDTKKLEDEVSALRENEHQIQKNQFFTNQNQHHVHHYTMIHILFWSALIIGTIWTIAYIRRQRPLNPLQPHSVDSAA